MGKRNKIIVFPRVQVEVLGFPDQITLTPAEAKAIERVHLGGIEALATPTYKCARKTIDSLLAKGLLDGKGPTVLGKHVGKVCAEGSFV